MTASASLPAMDVHDQMHRNESIADASGITKETGDFERIFSIHDGSDVDYYKITLATTGTAQNFLSIDFDGSLGQLELGLYDKDNRQVLSSTATQGGWQLNLKGLAAGDYYVRINGVSQAVNSYGLKWDLKNYNPAMDVHDQMHRNESIADASGITKETGDFERIFSIHDGADVDYYKISLATTGTAQNFLSIDFDGSLGQLELALYDKDNRQVLSSTATQDGRQLDFKGLAAGDYYVRINGVSQAVNSYGLKWDLKNYGPAMDVHDQMHRNESIADASGITKETGDFERIFSIHDGSDVDYYKITLATTGTAQNFLSIDFDGSLGQLELGLYDKDNRQVLSSTAIQDGRQLDFKGLAAGDYYVRINGVSQAVNSYGLKWDLKNYGPAMDVHDQMHRNESIADASGITKETGDFERIFSIHDGSDVDYYKITLATTGTARNFLSIDFDGSLGQLELALYDKDNDLVLSSSTIQDGRQLDFKGLAAGDYYVRINGVSQAVNSYGLKWDLKNYGPAMDVHDQMHRNESIADASGITKETGDFERIFSIHDGSDVDYYKITLATTGTARNFLSIDFDGSLGQLELGLYDKDNDLVLSSSATQDGRQLDFKGLAAGDYYVRINGVSQAVNSYGLKWDLKNYGPAMDVHDQMHRNESIDDASGITKETGDFERIFSIHDGSDVDYYKITLSAAGTARNFLSIDFDGSLGQLELGLYNKDNDLVLSSTAIQDGRQLDFKGLAAGDYYVRINGVSQAVNSYGLKWDLKNYGPAMDVHDQMHRNESIADASGITKDTGNFDRIFSIHDGSDVDYYKISLAAAGTAQNFLSIDFDGSLGQLELGLYDKNNSLVLSSTAIQGGRQLNLEGLAAGDYYVRINGVSQAVNSYGLKWDFQNYGPAMDVHDQQHRNESIADASGITKDTGNFDRIFSIHDGSDVDYYKITLATTGTAQNFLSIDFDGSLGQLELGLYDKDNRLLLSSSATQDGRLLNLKGLAAGDYYVRINGVSQAVNSYGLKWDFQNYNPVMDVHDQQHRNESIADASGITKETGDFDRIFSIHDSADVDYYKITLVNDGMAQNFLSIDFDASLGELELGLYDEDNSLVLSSSVMQDGRLLNLDGLAAGDYYVRINGVSQAVNSYGLAWDLKNYGIPVDVLDSQSRNDSLATATRITREQGPGTELSIHNATDEDYYQLVIAYTGTADNFVQIAFDAAQGGLTLELYDAQGHKVRSSSDVTGGKRISLEGLEPGAYYARVYSEEHARTTYTLSWNQAQRAPLPDDYFDRTKRNDSIATASTLPYTAGYYTGGTNIQLRDEDYFKVSLTARGTTGTYFLMNNINATGPLRADIVTADGDVLRTSAAWSSSSQKLSFEGLNPGTYYIKVYGDTPATTGTYDIQWDFYPGLQTLPEMRRPDMWTADALEGNDSLSTATTLLGAEGGNAALTLHNAADQDYYRVTLNAAGTAADYLQIGFTAAWGQLDMELLDASGRTVAASGAGSGSRRISLDGLAADTYYLRVHGVSDAHNAYTLTWHRADETASPASAATLSSSAGSMTGQQLTETAPAQYYAFSLAADGTASNYLAVNATESVRLTLLDSQERVLLTLDDASRLNLSGLNSGDYYLRVEAPISTGGNDARYTLSYNLEATPDAATVAGHDESSLFALNDAGTEYAYLMGYGNVSLSDFGSSSSAGVRLTSTDALYYDAEKSASNSRDDEQCWAGTASNMLVWSGWAEQGVPSATGSAAEDSIFALYNNNFPDSPGRIEDGIRWFFEKNYKTYSNSLTAASGSGNYIGMTATAGLALTELDDVSSLDGLAAALQNNMAVGLNLGFYSSVSSSSRISGHAITVWGYTCDITRDPGEAGYYTGLIVSDSDDDKYLSSATQAPDRLNIISISWNEAAQTYYTTYSAGNRVAKLEDFVALTPKEDWPTGAAATTVASLSDTGAGMDALLSGAMQPSAASMRASAELVASSGSDDRNRQGGMLTA